MDLKGNNTAGLDRKRETLHRAHAEGTPIDAYLAVNSAAMADNRWTALVKEISDTLFLAGDALNFQLDLLKVNKVHGLVGQIPYEMGALFLTAVVAVAAAACVSWTILNRKMRVIRVA